MTPLSGHFQHAAKSRESAQALKPFKVVAFGGVAEAMP
jgi:hypothetical protein